MPNVVILDDQDATVMLLSSFVQSISGIENIAVYGFTDEHETLDWLESNPADLILIDYKLNDLTGIEVIKNIRGYPQHANTPIIMVTEFKETNLQHDAVEAGANDFLRKPVEPLECQTRCKTFLEYRELFKKLNETI
jgi:CheY-like chemotaxis protein